MLRERKDKIERSGKGLEHLFSHDDIVLTLEWETPTDRRNALLNCAIAAQARAGYVYRRNVDFAPPGTHLETFNATYLDQAGCRSAPRIADRTARCSLLRSSLATSDLPGLPAAVLLGLRRLDQGIPKPGEAPNAEEGQGPVGGLLHVDSANEGHGSGIRMISEGWFDSRSTDPRSVARFKGMTTQDIYTKTPHFALLKEMLSQGSIVLTSDQEATVPLLL